MGYLIAVIIQLLAVLIRLVAGLVALVVGGAGTVLGLGLAGAVVLLVLLGVFLSPWFLLGLAAWAAWRTFGPRRPPHGTWYVVR